MCQMCQTKKTPQKRMYETWIVFVLWEDWCFHFRSLGDHSGTIFVRERTLGNHQWLCTNISRQGSRKRTSGRFHSPPHRPKMEPWQVIFHFVLKKNEKRCHCSRFQAPNMPFVGFWVNFGAPDPSIRSHRRSRIALSRFQC